MRMRGRGQAPASFLLGPLFMKCEALPASRRGSLPVPLLPSAWMAPQPARCTGGVRGARNLLGSLVSTFGHFLRGTLSSDSLGTPYSLAFVHSIVRATRFHALEMPKSCFRLSVLSQNCPSSPGLPPGGPPFAFGDHEPALAALPLRAAKRALPLVPCPSMMHN